MLTVLAQKTRKYYLWRKLKRAHRSSPIPEQLYFAYGANVQDQRFRDNKMVFERIGVARLPDFRLDFSLQTNRHGMGYGNVAKDPGNEVWGVLYKLDQTSLALLDVLEWVKYGYYQRVELTVEWTDANGTHARQTWVYVATRPKKGLMPASEYLQKIVGVGRALGYPEDYLEHVAATRHKPFQDFPPDHGFRIANPAKPRLFPKAFAPIYVRHDALRHQLMTRLP